MISSIQNNVSALSAFSKQVDTSANNVANSLTDNYKAKETLNLEGTPQGVETITRKIETKGPVVVDPLKQDGTTKELSNVDIAKEMVQQISAQNGFDANARVIKDQEEMVGTLLDIVG